MNKLWQLAIRPMVRQTWQNGHIRELSSGFDSVGSFGFRGFATSSSFKTEDERSEIEQYMREHSIRVEGNDAPDPILSFDGTSIPKNILNHVMKQFDKPTPIQSQALPIALEGRNMVGIGQTGSGKTLAFLLPALAHIHKAREARHSSDYRGPVALILTPTRELAQQIQEVSELYRRSSNVMNVCCIGGDSRYRQLERYDRGPELMIATPGRLNDFIQSGDMNISGVEYVVLDEADRMLDMGFEPQIRNVLKAIQGDKQVLMFSATWPTDVKELAEDFLGTYVFMNIGSTELSANKNITQKVVVCDKSSKHGIFLDTLQEIKDQKTLIFAETKATVDRLEHIIRKSGIRAMGIHGDKSQSARSNVIKRFKSGDCKIMIATDVAARGLDISNVEYVINYDFPNDIENYVHRIGRTGRSDKKGTSITFMGDDDANQAKKLVNILKEANQIVPEELEELVHQARGNKIQKRRYGAPGGGFQGYKSYKNRDDSYRRKPQYNNRRDDWNDDSTQYRSSRNRRDDSDPFY